MDGCNNVLNHLPCPTRRLLLADNNQRAHIRKLGHNFTPLVPEAFFKLLIVGTAATEFLCIYLIIFMSFCVFFNAFFVFCHVSFNELPTWWELADYTERSAGTTKFKLIFLFFIFFPAPFLLIIITLQHDCLFQTWLYFIAASWKRYRGNGWSITGFWNKV